MENPNLDFPFVGLLISGGHTMLLSANELGTYNLLGTTLDDAIGEAFDKTAKLMGLDYPGGPQIERIAKNGRDYYNFPRPLSDKKNCDFSFSGLKTHIVHTWKASEQSEQVQSDIASELQHTATDCLISRLENALYSQKSDTVIVSGGVSANSFIRQKLTEYCSSKNINVFFPSKEFCTDNGAMIAGAAFFSSVPLARPSEAMLDQDVIPQLRLG